MLVFVRASSFGILFAVREDYTERNFGYKAAILHSMKANTA